MLSPQVQAGCLSRRAAMCDAYGSAGESLIPSPLALAYAHAIAS